MRIRKGWSSHMPCLIDAVQQTKGPILELGSGLYSTPLLHWLCIDSGRKLVTYESNKEYYEMARAFRSKNHSIKFVEDWDKVGLDDYWSVILIDHVADRRDIDSIRLKNKADFLVIHDTQEEIYGYENVWEHFEHIFHYKKCEPWTSVVSNKKEFTKS